MSAAFKLQLSSFVNESEVIQFAESYVELEIEIVDQPMTFKEHEENMAEMFGEEGEMHSQSWRSARYEPADVFSLEIEVELETLLNGSSLKASDTGLTATSASFRSGCLAHALQLVLKDGLAAMEVVN